MDEERLERLMADMPLREPGARLDGAIAAMAGSGETERRGRPFLWRTVRLWQCAAACFVFAGLGFWASRLLTPPPTARPGSKVYVIRLTPSQERNVFDIQTAGDDFLLFPGQVRVRWTGAEEKLI